MAEKGDIREKLPEHGDAEKGAGWRVLRVDGLAARSLELTAEDLARLPQRDLTDDFTCLEGWKVPGVRWAGVPLDAVLALAEPRDQARYVEAGAGDFRVTLSREEAANALLALRLNGEPLPQKNGGPARLVLPGGQCFTSIKWLDRLELRATPGADSGKKIALDRMNARQSGKA